MCRKNKSVQYKKNKGCKKLKLSLMFYLIDTFRFELQCVCRYKCEYFSKWKL